MGTKDHFLYGENLAYQVYDGSFETGKITAIEHLSL